MVGAVSLAGVFLTVYKTYVLVPWQMKQIENRLWTTEQKLDWVRDTVIRHDERIGK